MSSVLHFISRSVTLPVDQGLSKFKFKIRRFGWRFSSFAQIILLNGQGHSNVVTSVLLAPQPIPTTVFVYSKPSQPQPKSQLRNAPQAFLHSPSPLPCPTTPPSRHRITPITGAGRTIQRTVHAHIRRVVGANKAEKEGIPALAAVSQSGSDAQTINIVASIGNSIGDAWRDGGTDGWWGSGYGLNGGGFLVVL